MQRKPLLVFAFALAALVSGVFAQTAQSLPPLEFKPIPGDNNPIKPPFNIDWWFTGDPNSGKNGGGSIVGGTLPHFAGGGDFPSISRIWNPVTGKMEELPNGKGNSSVHGFGSIGTTIPPNRAGELILTAYPNAGNVVQTKDGPVDYKTWDTSLAYQKLFGLPPKAEEGLPFGVADPTVEQPNGGYIFVKNGFPGESSAGGVQVAPTRCISDDKEPDKPRINCLNFSLKAKQPFKIAVTVYDQFGNFVTQYREVVTEQEFRSVVQAPGLVDVDAAQALGGQTGNNDGICAEFPSNENFGKENVVTLNGYVKVNVNIYPFFADGRRFSNGVYLLKIDRVDIPYKGCVNINGFAQKTTEPFTRYHADAKFGWMKAAPSKK